MKWFPCHVTQWLQINTELYYYTEQIGHVCFYWMLVFLLFYLNIFLWKDIDSFFIASTSSDPVTPNQYQTLLLLWTNMTHLFCHFIWIYIFKIKIQHFFPNSFHVMWPTCWYLFTCQFGKLFSFNIFVFTFSIRLCPLSFDQNIEPGE